MSRKPYSNNQHCRHLLNIQYVWVHSTQIYYSYFSVIVTKHKAGSVSRMSQMLPVYLPTIIVLYSSELVETHCWNHALGLGIKNLRYSALSFTLRLGNALPKCIQRTREEMPISDGNAFIYFWKVTWITFVWIKNQYKAIAPYKGNDKHQTLVMQLHLTAVSLYRFYRYKPLKTCVWFAKKF